MGVGSLLLNLLMTSVVNDMCVCSNDFTGFPHYRAVIHNVPGSEAFRLLCVNPQILAHFLFPGKWKTRVILKTCNHPYKHPASSPSIYLSVYSFIVTNPAFY